MRLADELGCPTLGVLAGSRLAGVSMVIQLNTFRENLAWALPRAAAAGRTVTLALLNPDDAPRYLPHRPGPDPRVARGRRRPGVAPSVRYL
jgi:hydroxypyruvate isomerase